MKWLVFRFGILLSGLLTVSCGSKPTQNGGYSYGNYYDVKPENVQFYDDVKANAQVTAETLSSELVDSKGNKVNLNEYQGKKNIVLVVMRGYTGGELCPYCTAQASRLIGNYDKFKQRDAEVLVVYPGQSKHVKLFVENAAKVAEVQDVPYPILLDENLKYIDRLGIRADLAKPATYLLDKKGEVFFAYVGQARTDRPSIKELLRQLDRSGKGASNKSQ